jgi:predicted nucleic acid-binding protein
MTDPVAVISDTGPLSYLHRLRRLDILQHLYSRVLVPPAVVAELNVGLRQGKDLPDVTTLDWIELRSPPAHALQGIDGLGAGETEGIALSRSIAGSLLLLDDGHARKVATSLGLELTGTVGVLLLAKERALLDRVGPELDRLQTFGFRFASAMCTMRFIARPPTWRGASATVAMSSSRETGAQGSNTLARPACDASTTAGSRAGKRTAKAPMAPRNREIGGEDVGADLATPLWRPWCLGGFSADPGQRPAVVLPTR